MNVDDIRNLPNETPVWVTSQRGEGEGLIVHEEWRTYLLTNLDWHGGCPDDRRGWKGSWKVNADFFTDFFTIKKASAIKKALPIRKFIF